MAKVSRHLSAGLLSREAFKAQVFARSNGHCVCCGSPAEAAHHIMDRKLFADGSCYLSNGAAVCESCHWRCETTELSVQDVLAAAGLIAPLLPSGLTPELLYDKWGNQLLPSGLRMAGPLKADLGMQRALARANLLWTLQLQTYCPDESCQP